MTANESKVFKVADFQQNNSIELLILPNFSTTIATIFSNIQHLFFNTLFETEGKFYATPPATNRIWLVVHAKVANSLNYYRPPRLPYSFGPHEVSPYF
jgi:hypothetical protein